MATDTQIIESTQCDLGQIKASVRGAFNADVAVGKTSWFGVGGSAQYLFKPEDQRDLQNFLQQHYPCDMPLTILGATSNILIRDGGISGVVIRLGTNFAAAELASETTIIAGAAMMDMNLAKFAAKHGRAGLEFFIGIPGSIGGAIFMNAGAYGREVKDVLRHAIALDRTGAEHRLTVADLDMQYRHTNAQEKGLIFTAACFETHADNPEAINAKMLEIRTARQDTQPVKARTGGSTFANPEAKECTQAGLPQPMKAWELIEAVGGRGMAVGGAVMSEKHCNFMINPQGSATAFDFELLGEMLRKKVFEKFGVTLRWEVRRIGNFLNVEQAEQIAALKQWEAQS